MHTDNVLTEHTYILNVNVHCWYATTKISIITVAIEKANFILSYILAKFHAMDNHCI